MFLSHFVTFEIGTKVIELGLGLVCGVHTVFLCNAW